MLTTQPTPHLLLRTDSGYRRLPLTGTNCWTVGPSE
ncbi:MAG: adenylate/guanylate cyclase domain-containing protein, partial [Leptolyngbyaceae cyanobacterium CAN_BIN12]|nr:adenylate/guanylate cyclase domain-containing protein [Leptolyngbyaceae cyanobacterium CAN_BIN12]